MTDWLTRYEASLSPAARRNRLRHLKVAELEVAVMRRCPWLRWPVLRVATTFWTSLFEEGVRATCKPRWGVLTFAYLNDGMRPTLWHTLRQITHDHIRDPYTGIYPGGAPRSLAEAERWEREWQR